MNSVCDVKSSVVVARLTSVIDDFELLRKGGVHSNSLFKDQKRDDWLRKLENPRRSSKDRQSQKSARVSVFRDGKLTGETKNKNLVKIKTRMARVYDRQLANRFGQFPYSRNFRD